MTIKSLQNRFHDLVHIFRDSGISFYEALEESIEANGGKVLRDAAIAAVAAAESKGGSGEDKFNYAVAAVVAVLTTEGLPILKNAIHGAVEVAVANLKAV